MKTEWWSFGQAASYLHANFPCETGVAASMLISDRVEDGSLRTRYENGPEIDKEEWQRVDDKTLVIEGADISNRDVQYDKGTVGRLCARSDSGGKGGRTPKKGWPPFFIEAIGIIHEEGLPAQKTEFVNRMLQWAQDNIDDPPNLTSVKEMVGHIYKRVNRA